MNNIVNNIAKYLLLVVFAFSALHTSAQLTEEQVDVSFEQNQYVYMTKKKATDPDMDGNAGLRAENKYDWNQAKDDITVEAWVYDHDTSRHGNIAVNVMYLWYNDGKYASGLGFGRHEHKLWVFGDRDNSIVTDVVWKHREWHHIALVYKAATKRIDLYFNGKAIYVDKSWSNFKYPNHGYMTVGGWDNNNRDYGNPWIGSIDEFRVWTKAMTAQDVQHLMQQSIKPEQANKISQLVAYYRFEESDPANGMINNSSQGSSLNLKKEKIPDFGANKSTNNRLGNFSFEPTSTQGKVKLTWNATWLQWERAKVSIQAAAPGTPNDWKDFTVKEFNKADISLSGKSADGSTGTKASVELYLVPGLQYRYKVDYGNASEFGKVKAPQGTEWVSQAPTYFGNSWLFKQTAIHHLHFESSKVSENFEKRAAKLEWTIPAGTKTMLDNATTLGSDGWVIKIEKGNTNSQTDFDNSGAVFSPMVSNVPSNAGTYTDESPVRCKFNVYRLNIVVKDLAQKVGAFSLLGNMIQFPIDAPRNISFEGDNCNVSATIKWENGSQTENPLGYLLKYRTKNTNGTWSAWSTDIDHSSTTTEYVHVFDNPSQIVNYAIAAKYPCGISEWYINDKEIKIEDITQIYDEKSLSASKGYNPEQVDLEIRLGANGNYGLVDKALIYRRLANSTATPTLLTTLDATETGYADASAATSVMYEYFVVGKKVCGGNDRYSYDISQLGGKLIDDVTDRKGFGFAIGIRYAEGIITGKVSYEGGVAVPNTKIFVAPENTQSTGSALSFNGTSAYAELKPEPAFINDSCVNITMSAMVKFGEATNKFESIFSKGWDIEVYRENKKLWFELDTDIGRYIAEHNVDYNLNNGKFHNIAFTYNGDTAKLFLNGVNIAEIAARGAIQTDSKSFYIGGIVAYYYLKGIVDDVKIYSKSFTDKEMFEKYNSITSPDDKGLECYWRFDEGSGKMGYDVSTKNDVPNKNDITLKGYGGGALPEWTNDVPSVSELGYTAMTNENGNYTIRGIMYGNGGENFLVMPSKNDGGYDHVYDPKEPKTVFIGDETQVINSVDFKDVSSFTFAGRVLFEGYTTGTNQCGSAGVGFAIDGRRVLVDGEPYETGMDGNFNFQVPIGEHTIELLATNREFDTPKVTHTFTNHWNRTTPFIDKTKVKVVGRVIGGNTEANKACRAGATNNNLGVATVKFETLSGCIVESTQTGADDGYYEIMLPPAKYKMHAKLNNANDTWQSGDEKFKFGTLTQVDVSLPNWKEEYDSVYTTNALGEKLFDYLDTIRYHYKRDVVYQAPININVTGSDVTKPFVGEQQLEFYDGMQKKMLQIYPGDDISQPSQIGYPAFVRNRSYRMKLHTRESYKNFDNNNEYHYPVQNAKVYIDNELGVGFGVDDETGRKVIYENGKELRTNNNGVLDYRFTAGEANTLESGSLSFLKKLNLTVSTGKATAQWPVNSQNQVVPYWAYIFGSGKTPGNDFITKTPEMVDYILRDPGGSNSYAYLEKGTSFSNIETFSTVISAGTHIHAFADFGPETTISGGIVPLPEVEVDILAANETDLTTGINTGIESSVVTTYTTSTRIETSQNSDFTGAGSDLFIGKSTNLLMSETKGITLVRKADQNVSGLASITIGGVEYVVGTKTTINVTPQSIETTFIYDQVHIQDHLIPNMVTLRNSYFDTYPQYYTSSLSKTDVNYGKNNDDPKIKELGIVSYTFSPDPKSDKDYARIDQIRWLNQQIALWEKHLADNEKAKIDAKSPIDNVSINGGNYYEYSTSNSKVTSFNTTIEVAIAGETNTQTGITAAGLESNGLIGVTYGSNIVTVIGDEDSDEKTVGYVLSDPELTDYFTIDVYEGSSNRGPIFKTKGGRSACPWEGPEHTQYYEPGTLISEGTIQVDKPEMVVLVPVVNNVPANAPAVYELHLKNASSSKDDMDFQLYVEQGSNPYGAVLKVDGHDLSNAYTYSIPYGDSIKATLTLERGPVEYEYKDIQLTFASLCDDNDYAKSTKSITAMFTEECSPIDMLIPADNWVLNVASNDSLSVFMNNYALQHKNFDKITFQYKTQAEAYYQDLVHFYLDANNTEYKQNQSSTDAYKLINGKEFLNYDFVMDDQYPDNYYTVRAKTTCNDVIGYSNSVDGIKDTQVPQVFGNTEPANGVLTNEDIIGLRFNEPINPITLSKNTIFLTGKMNGSSVQHDASIAFGTSAQDKVEISDIDLSRRSFTLEFYTQKDTTKSGTQILFNHGANPANDFVVGFNSENKLFVEFGNKTITTNAAITKYWTHYAIAYDVESGNMKVYVNGDLYEGVEDNGFTTEYGETGKMLIGNTINAAGTGYKGKIHEVRLWKKPLAKFDINVYKAIELVGNEPGLWYNWPMNELNSNITTDKVRLKQASMKANWNTFPVGYALTDFKNDIVGKTAGVAIGKDKDFTIEFWFTGSGINKSMVSNGVGGIKPSMDDNINSWDISLNSDGKVQVTTNGKKIISENRYNDGKWHHIAVIKRAQANVTLYVDGNKQGELAASETNGFSAGSLFVGARGYYAYGNDIIDQELIDGAVDELRIWKLARKIDQVKRDMNITLSGKEKGLIKYYPFDVYVDASGSFESSYKAQNYIDDKNKDTDEFKQTTTLNQSTPLMRLPQPTQRILSNYLLNDDQIVITPTVKSSLIENVLLDVTILGVEDLQGNPSDPITWTAYVDKNQVIWDNDEFKREHEYGKELVLMAKIVNKGGLNTYYELKNVPSWITVEETEGYIEPLSTKTVELKVAAGVAVGRHTDDIILMTDFGFGEKLSLDIDIYKAMPDSWEPVTDKYENTMTVTGQLKINNVISRNKRDVLAAFVNGECRGFAKLTYNGIFDAWFVNMSVAGEAGDQITYKIWNGAAGEVLALESVTNAMVKQFSNTNYGSLNNAVVFTGGQSVESIFELHEGYNWISFNTLSSDAGNAPYLMRASVNATKKDKISNKEGKQLTYDAKNNIWLGNLTSVELNSGYKYFANAVTTFNYTGSKADNSLYPVSLKAGWNWIGILGTNSMDINEALSNYNAQAGDFIKSKTAFAQYYEGSGWQGSLKYLEPNQMYMMNVSTDASFTYPAAAKKAGAMVNAYAENAPWEVNSNQYPDHMDVTATLCNYTADNGYVGAFINGECRGYSNLEYVETTNQYVAYLPVHGSSADAGKTVTYKFYDGTSTEIFEASNELSYDLTQPVGDAMQPYCIQLVATDVSDINENAFSLYPNPANSEANLSFTSDKTDAAIITLHDMSGRLIYMEKVKVYQGENTYTLNVNNFNAGSYLVKIKSDNFNYFEKLIIEK